MELYSSFLLVANHNSHRDSNAPTIRVSTDIDACLHRSCGVLSQSTTRTSLLTTPARRSYRTSGFCVVFYLWLTGIFVDQLKTIPSGPLRVERYGASPGWIPWRVASAFHWWRLITFIEVAKQCRYQEPECAAARFYHARIRCLGARRY